MLLLFNGVTIYFKLCRLKIKVQRMPHPRKEQHKYKTISDMERQRLSTSEMI